MEVLQIRKGKGVFAKMGNEVTLLATWLVVMRDRSGDALEMTM